MSISGYRQVLDTLTELGDIELARRSRRYFKTGPGDYAEGDKFLGIRMPELRHLAQQYTQLPFNQVEKLLHSEFHEARITALLIWVQQFKKADKDTRKQLAEGFLNNTEYINNWDLVDCSSHLIIGPWAEQTSTGLLRKLAISDSLWERRIAMMSTLHFIRKHDFSPTFDLAELLLGDSEDLVHKIVGWMLREVGNRDRSAEEKFLRRHYTQMPRTMLRYAIEKFPETRRQAYLRGTV